MTFDDLGSPKQKFFVHWNLHGEHTLNPTKSGERHIGEFFGNTFTQCIVFFERYGRRNSQGIGNT